MTSCVSNNSSRPAVLRGVERPSGAPSTNRPGAVRPDPYGPDQVQIDPAFRRQLERAHRIEARVNAVESAKTTPSSSMSTAQLQQALKDMGFGGRALRASDAELRKVYDTVQQAITTPGNHKFSIKLGGKKFDLKIKVKPDGSIAKFSVKKHKKHGFFSKLASWAKKPFDIGKKIFDTGLGIGKKLLDTGLNLGKGLLETGLGLGKNLLGGLLGGGQQQQ